MIFALFAIFHIFASEILDIEMSAKEKKATGLYKLTDKEKAALQQWIDARYQKKPDLPEQEAARQEAPSGIRPTLSENLMQSRYLRLSDNTLWQVRPADVPIAQGWITPVEIMVAQSRDPIFSYQLTNKVSGSSVLARRVEQLP